MGEFREQIFEGQSIILDGNRFTGCTFRNCVLRFSAASAADLRANHFEDVRFEFEGSAAMTLGFLAALYRDGGGFEQIVESTFENVRSGMYLK